VAPDHTKAHIGQGKRNCGRELKIIESEGERGGGGDGVKKGGAGSGLFQKEGGRKTEVNGKGISRTERNFPPPRVEKLVGRRGGNEGGVILLGKKKGRREKRRLGDGVGERPWSSVRSVVENIL